MQHRGVLLLALLTLLALTSAVAKKKGDMGFGGLKEGWRPAGEAGNPRTSGPPGFRSPHPRKGSPSESLRARGPELCSPCVLDKVKKGSPGSECSEWTWGPCTPSSKDCGAGFREGTCGAQTQRIRCRVPCNWKKEFGGEVGRRRRARKG